MRVSRTDMREEAKMEIMSMIWYLIATSGSEPPRICPVIVPGRAMSPITAIEAMVGLKNLMRASRMKGVRASWAEAPLARRKR